MRAIGGPVDGRTFPIPHAVGGFEGRRFLFYIGGQQAEYVVRDDRLVRVAPGLTNVRYIRGKGEVRKW